MQDKLKQQISESPLAREEQEVLMAILETLSEEHRTNLSSLFEESPWLIPYLYINVAAKKYALEKEDNDALRTIIDNEIQVLQSIDEAERE